MDNITVRPKTEHFMSDVRAVCAELVPAATMAMAEVTTKQLTLGITNQLFVVTVQSFEGGVAKRFLLRIFGAEGIIDRTIENGLFKALAEAGVAPAYLGRFVNGRCEEFLTGWANLEVEDMHRPDISACVAVKVAEMHSFVVPPPLDEKFDSTQSGLWGQLTLWIDVLQKTPIADEGIASGVAAFADEFFGGDKFLDLRKWARDLHAHAPAGAMLCFSHNDLLAFNIMRRQRSSTRRNGGGGSGGGSDVGAQSSSLTPPRAPSPPCRPEDIRLIDFEYGCYNYRGFDIANHFCEWAGGSDDAKPKYEHFPTQSQQRTFCVAYLAARRQLTVATADGGGGGGGGGDAEANDNNSGAAGSGGGEKGDANSATATSAEESELRTLLREVAYFVPVVHVYWTVWALNQARDEGCQQFDYLLYARHRFAEAVRRRVDIPVSSRM